MARFSLQDRYGQDDAEGALIQVEEAAAPSHAQVDRCVHPEQDSHRPEFRVSGTKDHPSFEASRQYAGVTVPDDFVLCFVPLVVYCTVVRGGPEARRVRDLAESSGNAKDVVVGTAMARQNTLHFQ